MSQLRVPAPSRQSPPVDYQDVAISQTVRVNEKSMRTKRDGIDEVPDRCSVSCDSFHLYQFVYGEPVYGEPVYGEPVYGESVYGDDVLDLCLTGDVLFWGDALPNRGLSAIPGRFGNSGFRMGSALSVRANTEVNA